MNLASFCEDPWKKSHEAYSRSSFAISPAPEYASSEILISSLYRAAGFGEAAERSIPSAGRDLDKRVQTLRDKRRPRPDGATVDADVFGTLLHGILESPKRPNQSSKRFIQVSPLVPGLALISGTARIVGNSWFPGSLIRKMVWLGCPNPEIAHELWADLFNALSINERDDVFASWLQREMTAWAASSHEWKQTRVDTDGAAQLGENDFRFARFPAQQFAKDLRAVIDAKDVMTRRQWTSLLEAIIRLAAVTHVVWLCDVQTRIWRCVAAALEGSAPRGEVETRSRVIPVEPQYMTYGGRALSGIKDHVSSYLSSRLALNAVLWALKDLGSPYEGNLSSSSSILKLCDQVSNARTKLAPTSLTAIAELQENEARALLCKKGIGSNLMEFSRYVLQQRLTANPLLRGYDQGYVMRKKGNSASSPWVVALGPLSVLALVHCALAGVGGPRSIHRLGQHLSAYGVVIDRHDIANNNLGAQLRMLGLVLDSPDAESGMLLLPPFARYQSQPRK